MSLMIRHDDPVLSWHGIVELETTKEWTRPWRLPVAELPLLKGGLAERAGVASGVRLVFRTDSPNVTLHFAPPLEGEEKDPTSVDLISQGETLGTAKIQENRADFSKLPPADKEVELWLPNGFYPCRVTGVELDDKASIYPSKAAEQPKWLTYGSSITMCRGADSPSLTWPARVARSAGLDLTNLGYGGECHLDIQAALAMRALPADYLSLCVGINIYGGNTFAPRSFKAQAVGFIRLLREKHLQTPMIVISPIFSCQRETECNAVGYTLIQMREDLAEVVDQLREQGDANLHYVDGLELFGAADEAYLPDRLHPDTAGMGLIAERFQQKVVQPYFK